MMGSTARECKRERRPECVRRTGVPAREGRGLSAKAETAVESADHGGERERLRVEVKETLTTMPLRRSPSTSSPSQSSSEVERATW